LHNDKLNIIQEDITEIKVNVAKIETTLDYQQQILTEHMARTKLNEERLDKLELPYKVIAYLIGPASLAASIVAILTQLKII
jgi:hypothetical protein